MRERGQSSRLSSSIGQVEAIRPTGDADRQKQRFLGTAPVRRSLRRYPSAVTAIAIVLLSVVVILATFCLQAVRRSFLPLSGHTAFESQGQEGPRHAKVNPTHRKELNEIISLHTDQGVIRINYLRKCSPESIQYVEALSSVDCDRCQLYRAEKNFLLQGVMSSRSMPPNKVKGPCPVDATPYGENHPRTCFPHDPDCGCHGPVMTKGMVAWAGGTAGPDFFIYVGADPAKHWHNDHTVWGILADEASFDVVERIISLDRENKGGMTMLTSAVSFHMEQLDSDKKKLISDSTQKGIGLRGQAV